MYSKRLESKMVLPQQSFHRHGISSVLALIVLELRRLNSPALEKNCCATRRKG